MNEAERASGRPDATVDVQHLPRDVARGGAAQEQDGADHFAGIAQALQGNELGVGLHVDALAGACLARAIQT